jgi:hypothetical protein
VAVEVDEVDAPLALSEFPDFIRVLETLPHECGHVILLT